MNSVHAPPSQPTPSTPVDTDRTAPLEGPGRLRTWSVGHLVTGLLVIGFAIAHLVALPFMAGQHVMPDSWMLRTAGVDAERIASGLGILLGLLPAALWVTWAVDGADGVRSLGRRMGRWQIVAWVALLYTLVHRLDNDEGLVAALIEGDAGTLAVLISVVMLTAAAVMVSRCHSEPGQDQP